MHDVSCSANGDDKGISGQINREIRAYGCNEWRDPALEKLQAPEGAVKWARQEAKRQDDGHDRANSPRGEDAKPRIRDEREAGPPKT